MVVAVHFFGVQRELTKTWKIQVPLIENSQVKDVCEYLKGYYPNLPLDEDDVFVTVNDSVSDISHRLRNDDKVAFLPHMGGG